MGQVVLMLLWGGACRQMKEGQRRLGRTWRAGAADVQRIIQLGHSVLDDVLGLGHGALQQQELLLQQLLLQLLLLTRLEKHVNTRALRPPSTLQTFWLHTDFHACFKSAERFASSHYEALYLIICYEGQTSGTRSMKHSTRLK